MPTTLEALQAQILGLPKADRSRLFERLVASLDMDSDAELQWEALADERDKELESGVVEPVLLEDAMARLQARFPG